MNPEYGGIRHLQNISCDQSTWHRMPKDTTPYMLISFNLYFEDDKLSLIFISVISQLDAQNFCFTISLVHVSTCFEHMCSKHVET